MICEIDGLVLKGVQFGVLAFADWGAVGGADGSAGASFQD